MNTNTKRNVTSTVIAVLVQPVIITLLDFDNYAMLQPWIPWLILALFLAAWIAVQFGLLLLIKFILYNFDWTTKLELKLPHIRWKTRNRTFVFHRNKFKKTNNAEKIIEFVWNEYRRDINALDATILELIHRQKTTISQLNRYFGLSFEHAEYRVKKMRRFELVSKEKLKLHKDLAVYFKYLPLDNFIIADNVNTCNEPNCDEPALTNARACQDHVCNSCQVGWKSGHSVCRSCQRWWTMVGTLGVAVTFAAAVMLFVFS